MVALMQLISRDYCPLQMSTNNWMIGGVSVPNFFKTRESFAVFNKADIYPNISEFMNEINPYLATVGLMPLIRKRQIIYRRKHATTQPMLMFLWTNADDSFGWMRYEGRVPGDKRFFYLFDGQKHMTDDWGYPLNHPLFDTKHEFIPYLLHEWHAAQQQLYRDLQERHRMNMTGSLCRISHDIVKHHIMSYLIE